MSLKEYLSSIPPNEYRNVFKDSFPYLIEEGYLEALAGGSFETFHQKFINSVLIQEELDSELQ